MLIPDRPCDVRNMLCTSDKTMDVPHMSLRRLFACFFQKSR